MTKKTLILSLSVALIFGLSSCGIFNRANKNPGNSSGKARSPEAERTINTALIIDAKKEMILGNYQEAAAIYNQCLKRDPSNSVAYYELAEIYHKMKDFDRSVFNIKKAIKLDEKNHWYKLLYADILQLNGKYEEAADVYSKVAKQFPENPDYQFNLAELYTYARKLNEALKIYDNIEQNYGVSEEVCLRKESIYLATNKTDKAIKELEKLIKEFPTDTRFLGLLGEIYLSTKEIEKAFEVYEQILKIEPNNSYVHLSLADYYNLKGDKEKSFSEVKIAFENPELNIDNKISILVRYFQITESYPELKVQVYELLDILLKVHPNEAKAYAMNADFLNRDKKYTEARNSFRRVIELDSSKYLIWEQLLLVESDLKDNEALINEGERAMELFPEQVLPYLFAGMGHFNSKNYVRAIEVLKLGLNFAGTNNAAKLQMLIYLGDAYHNVKNHELSDKAYDDVLALDPENIYILNNYAYYLSLRNTKLEKAEKMSKKSNEIKKNSSTFEDTYAWVLYKMEKYEDAKIWIEKAMNNGGDKSGAILEHYGDILFKLSETEKAVEVWIKAKETGNASDLIDKKIQDKKLYE
ncbi:MAG: tetratricopeptide repeat protein [Saprospiraceae bacterium]|nr:tetratricopeptide repeat protein [Saprospiraceae bacterium]